jgi:hypothetical protein
VDPSWPKPLPNNWRIAQVGGIAVDTHDNIWVYHRPRSLGSSEARAMPAVGTNANGVPVSGVGHPRPNGQPLGGCCVPAPSVLKFDPEGNLLDAWGGPADPGFLEENCRPADGCFWPAREHGIFVDHNDFVYISGNGEAGGANQQQGMPTYPWAPTFGDDSHVLKFTADGRFVWGRWESPVLTGRTARRSTVDPTEHRSRTWSRACPSILGRTVSTLRMGMGIDGS